jgi:2-aminobenzoate-CoA ligase
MPALKQRELQQIITETEPRCLITTPELLPVFDECGDLPGLRVVVGRDGRNLLLYEECITAGSSVYDPAPTAEDDVAIIAYTSGSTGRQKGTVHTHSDILAIADTYARGILAPTTEDCFAGQSPMAFTYGLGGLVIFPLRFGACTVIDSNPFDPGRWLDTVLREKVTLLFATPTAARVYLEERSCGSPTTWRTVRAVVSAGEPLTKRTFDRWRETTGTEILDGCGSTEMLHIWISQRRGQATGGCTGWPVPLYQARLEDDGGQEMRANEAEGVVALQGPTGCRYWCQPELQAEAVRDGWTSTGDRFHRDAGGRYWFLGRTDDMIVSAGYKVSPVEVQEVLLGCPEIREAAVVGVPHEIRGQVVRACVTLKPGFLPGETLAQQVRESVKQRMAAFKCPREIVFLEELPRTSTGKVDRRLLQEVRSTDRSGDGRRRDAGVRR